MAFYGNTPAATATVSANTNVVTITGIDLSLVTPGMTISFGARDRETGDRWLIGSVSPAGSSGGTLTTQGSIPTAYSNVPFLINTTGYLGTDASYAAAVGLAILSALSTLLGAATNLYSGARQLVLDKVAATAVGRIMFAIAGRSWAAIEQRTFAFTPTGGQATAIETLALRASADGTTWSDALLIDLPNGTGDLRKGSATLASAAMTDLGSAPAGKAAITGGATITSFGPGRHLDRLVHFVDGGATLTHNGTSLILQGGANIVTRAGDTLHATSDGAGNWRVHRYTRANGLPLMAPFRDGGYATLATQQYIAAADYGRSFTWALADGYVLLPLGSSVLPGWYCQIRLTGVPVGYGRSSIVTPGFADQFLFNGRAQAVDTAQSVRGFVVVGGNEEFRFTWTGGFWLVETVQSPAVGWINYVRLGSGGYAATPTAFTNIGAAVTGGFNNVAAAPYNLGFYAPCDGLYRLHARTRFYNDVSGATYAGFFGLASADPASADLFDGAPYRSFQFGEYEDVAARCTKRLGFGQVATAYKGADNTNLKSSGGYEVFYAELLSRG